MQILILGAIPLALLIAVLLCESVIQRTADASFARLRLSTEVLSASDRIYDVLDSESQQVQAFEKTRDRSHLARAQAIGATLGAYLTRIDAKLPRSGKSRAMFTPYAKLTEDVSAILRHYIALESAPPGAAKRYAATPQVATTLRAWRDTKTEFDRVVRSEALAVDDRTFRENSRYQNIALLVTILGCVLTLGVFSVFGLRIVRRTKQVAWNIAQLSEGGAPRPVPGTDEIAWLDERYREATAELRRAIAEKTDALSAYERERRVAATLQQALLPRDFPRHDGLQVYTAYVAAEREYAVGGDWYDVFDIDDHVVGISAGDVSGHGIAAATLMAGARQLVRSAARASDSPSVVLEHVNRVLCSDEPGIFVSAVFAAFDRRTGVLRYALGGHPPPIVASVGMRARTLAGNGLLLGVERAASFTTYETVIDPGSAIVFYTDGIIEHRRDAAAGMRQLLAAVSAEHARPSTNPADSLQERILGGEHPHDDSAVLYLVYAHRRIEGTTERVEWSFDARREDESTRVKRALFWHLSDRVAPLTLTNIEVVYGELIANVVRHTPGRAKVEVDTIGDHVILRVSDEGDPFDSQPAEALLMAESGRGMFLIGLLTDQYHVTRHEHGNCVAAHFPRLARNGALTLAAGQ